ncbi:MAG: hypothetical protein ABJO01_06875 [Parasphingorhabdus sp.]|uniref:hypothetical protein n=1 Tax=Parasphingorhabdus sp. TaxID=2709688 RepID=UPI003298E8CE
MRITIAFSAILLAAGCSAVVPAPAPSQSAAAAPTPAPAPASAPAPKQPEGNWIDWPLSAGDWVYRQDDRGSIALFGPPNAEAIFMIRCDQGRNQLFVSREGTVANSGAQMTLRASSGLQSFSARNSGGTLNYAATMIPVSDIIMDRIAFSRGRFAVETTGLQSIAIPIWPEFTRVVEDCRS